MNFIRDEFVQWTGTDQAGKFSHIGQVVSCSDESIEFVTPHGVISTSVDDGAFRHISRPQDWSVVLPKSTKKPVKTTHTKPTVKPMATAKVGSKKEKALDLYTLMMDNGSHPQRKDVIESFMANLDMTKAGASTYQAMCKKAH